MRLRTPPTVAQAACLVDDDHACSHVMFSHMIAT